MRVFKGVMVVIFFACCFSVFADSSYTVKKGDTLYSISKKYEITVAELRTANNLKESDVLKIGQRLVIPSANISNAAALSSNEKNNSSSDTKVKSNAPSASSTDTYTVLKGDTLYSIAKKHGMSLSELLNANNLSKDATIKVGQQIKVAKVAIKPSPASSTSSSSSSSSASSLPQSGTQGDSSLLWPVENPVVVYKKGKISAVELFSKKDEDVKSIRSGTVMYTGAYRGYGNIVFVESKTGLIYAYSWLGSVSVKKGDYVVCGESVGKAGVISSGKSGLSFMVFKNGVPMDPAKAPRG
ncbi:MAG: LysM peptidoglycan-binding domain-containing protein [Treponema sp.]|nr:LysM peptidoglycan-binding domain-containing protein [Treponema sp.]